MDYQATPLTYAEYARFARFQAREYRDYLIESGVRDRKSLAMHIRACYRAEIARCKNSYS